MNKPRRPETPEDLRDYLLNVDIDIDIWSRGRDAAAAGRLTDPMLRACYPYVEINFRDQVKWEKVLKEHFEQNHNYIFPFLMRQHIIVFQTKYDRDLFMGLMYLY